MGYSGSSLSFWLCQSSTNLLYREDFSGLYRSRRGMFRTGQSALGWPLEGVRVWKLSRMYPGEKPPSLSLNNARMLFCHSNTHTEFSGNTQHPRGDESPLRGFYDSFSPTCSCTTATVFPKIFFILIIILIDAQKLAYFKIIGIVLNKFLQLWTKDIFS